MPLPRPFSGEMTIATSLLCWFLVIALVPCLILTAVIQYISTQSLRESIEENLGEILHAKTVAIDSYTRERRADAALGSTMSATKEALGSVAELLQREPLDSPAYLAAVAPLNQRLSVFLDIYSYDNAFIFDSQGRVILRLKADIDAGPNLLTGPLKDSELANVFKKAKESDQSVFSEFAIYPGTKEARSFVAHNVADKEGKVIGVIALQLGLRMFYEILEDYTGLGETGEALTAQLHGETITFLAPLRFDRDAAYRRTLKMGAPNGYPIQRATLGESGSGASVDYRGIDIVAVWTYLPALRWGLVVKQDREEVYKLINHQRMAVAAVLLAILAGVVIPALLVARGLANPVRAAAEAANRVASGDLTVAIDLEAKGEVGQLVKSIRTMTLDLRSLIGKVQRSSVSLMSTATEIAATAKQQEQTVHDRGSSTNEAAAAVKQISATSQELLRTMTEVNQVASETADIATLGKESLSGMDRTMRHLADSTGSISSKLSVISERAANINVFVTTINKVADQTNLLSINAAIEAEKAGEYGLGFLVVAREIRHLADQTALSTLDIERMVKEMQYSVSAGVMEMDKFSEQVRQGVREVGEIGSRLGGIIVAVQGLNNRFEQVTEGMKAQSQGADQIREAVVRINDGAGQTLDSLREFNQATGHLRQAVGELKDEVSRFKVESNAS